ncbi:hypothetical protein [Streptomyces sp. NPDC002990]
MRAFPVVMPSGQKYWTVLDDDLETVTVADHWLRNLRFGRDRAELTTKAYAGGVALYLRWCGATGRSWPDAGRDLGLFMVWLKYTPAPRDGVAAVVRPGPGAAPVRCGRRINRVLVAVRGLLSYAVSAGETPRGVLGQICELADSRDLPAEATGEDGGLFYRLRPVHRLREPAADVDRAGPTTDIAKAREWLESWTDVSGVEGILVKGTAQRYLPGYRGWTKIRRRDTTEAVIGAITGTLARPGLLVLGRHDEAGRLRTVGRTVPLRPEQARQVVEYLAAAGPGHPWEGVRFAAAWGSRDVLDAVLVRPELVAEVSADRAVDRGGVFRHPLRFKRLRLDVTMEDVPRFGAGPVAAAG